MPEKRRTKPQMNNLKTVIAKTLTGSLAGLVLFFLLTAISSAILWKTDADSEIYKYIILAVGGVSALVCGFIAVRPVRKNGIVFGALSVLPFFLITIVISMLISKSGVGLFGWILLGIQLVLSAIGGIIAVNKRK